jgi:hypothetical protein
VPFSFLYFGVWDEMAANPAIYPWLAWHPDAAEFRKSDIFKAAMRKSGVLAFWQARGFPPQCKPVGDDDFVCTEINTKRRRTRGLVN